MIGLKNGDEQQENKIFIAIANKNAENVVLDDESSQSFNETFSETNVKKTGAHNKVINLDANQDTMKNLLAPNQFCSRTLLAI